MGGNAFANHDPPLQTPRLSSHEYRRVRDGLVARLREHFRRVVVPIDGPAKTSFGDVDIIVSEPNVNQGSARGKSHPEGIKVHPDNVSKILGATARVGDSYAILKTSLLAREPQESHPAPASDSDGKAEAEEEEAYVQVDVTVLPPSEVEWHYFMHCHGDAWNMLGPSLRRVDLVLTDIGLCLVNPVIAPHDRKRSRLVLTRDPDTALAFLGLDVDTFWGKDALLRSSDGGSKVPEFFGEPDSGLGGRPFATEDEHFAFVASSRFFDPEAYHTSKDLKAQDRRRMKYRAAYARFVADFVPALLDSSETKQAMTAEETRHDALRHFDKFEEYEGKEKTWKEEQKHLDEKRLQRLMRKDVAEQDIHYADAWMGKRG